MMASNWTDTEARSRGARMLRTAIGPMVGHWQTDPLDVEVMHNPDGCLWVDRLGTGLADTGRRPARPEDGRVGNASVSTGSSRGSPSHYKEQRTIRPS